ncbi:MAG: hypothetical protein RLZZ210_1861, partial [Pseudomonadota bacterium]
MNQNICTAHLNDVQFLRLYGLSLQRQFLYQQVEKKLIQNLQPINIKPKHILNLGADLTLHKNHRLNLNSYNLYDKLPKTTNVIINKILLDKYKNKSYISHTSSNNYSNNILNGISNAFTKAKNIISKDSDTKIINEDVLFTDDILNIPQQIKPNSIDIIYSNLSLNYYNDLPNILQTWSKVLTNQGLIIFSL